ncbi:MAG: VOC family protein [Pseudomonadota bacterium]
MIAYSTIPVNDMAAARKFYDALLGDMGAKVMMERPDGGFVAYGDGKGPMFGICKPWNGEPANPGNGNMVSIACSGPDQVKTMYDKAIALGATDEGPAGPRLNGMCSCGYVRDADGNKLNFFCMGA